MSGTKRKAWTAFHRATTIQPTSQVVDEHLDILRSIQASAEVIKIAEEVAAELKPVEREHALVGVGRSR